MVASAHLLLDALSKPAVVPTQASGPVAAAYDVTDPDIGYDVEAPLTSEPPLADAAPLTSEPPLADPSHLTSEPTATGTAAGY
ncbi:hypothetical protein [Streptomyces sp. NPDC060194]|uniref:hypothetical protein n=1 Tax=Streptomyces sp. NPDC060194 TaxID=3347069 RepID=UPI00364E7129